MKKAEAIAWLEIMKEDAIFEQYDALKIAIDALQGDMYCPNCGVRLVPENEYVEPTQTHGRLIDADALKKKAQECATEAWKMNLTARIETVLNQFIDWINDAPTVQADRPHGEWILECDSEGEGDNLYRCSKCGCKYGCQEYDKPNFCPDCGVNMRGEHSE